MSGLRFKIHVEPEVGDPFDVMTDQRDVAAWELEPFGGPIVEYRAKVYTFCRFVAWHALKRQGKTKMAFRNWSDTIVDCLERDDVEGADEQQDPGTPAPSAGIS